VASVSNPTTMPDLATLALFAAASLALLVVPGPAVVYIVTRSVAHGRAAGLVSMLGVEAGGLVHVAAAAAGLSALVASSATAFSVVKYAGAAYLVYLGLSKLLHSREPAQESGLGARGRLFWDGLVVNLLNPKTALFFLAFLPQFVDPARGAAWLQIALLGMLFVALAVISDGAYALLAGAAGRWIRAGARSRRRLDRASGGIYVGLGAAAALSGTGRTS
jgi:threonine/homoserine/homoserine lactone efflux protein